MTISKITFKEFDEFIAKVNEYFSRLDKKTEEEFIMLKTIKVWEEVWELNEQILKSLWRFRKEKWAFNQEDLEKEISDVLITVWWLWIFMWVDMDKTLKDWMERIKKRHDL